MKTSVNGRQLIESFEGLFLETYDDSDDRIVAPGGTSKGTLTIGYGHTTAAGPPKVVPGMKITKQQANQYLTSDLSQVEKEVTNLVKVPLNQNQFDALVSFQYNTGALGKSSILRLLNAKNYTQAAQNLLLYNRGNGQVLEGLVHRRAAEKNLFLRPVETNTASTGTAGAVILGGTAIATQYPHHWGYVLLGTAAAAIVAWLLVTLFKKVK